jgi:hypothetical protein
MPHGRIRYAFLAMALVGLTASLALGDIVHLKTGGKVEGEIIERTDLHLKVKTRFGVQTVLLSQLARIEEKETPQAELERLRAALQPGDVEGRLELAAHCRKHGFVKEWKRLMEEVVLLDPMNEVANTALGRILHDGRWMTEEERDELESRQEEARMRAQGLVLHEGRWVTPEERTNREKGLILKDGRWMTEEEARLAEGYVRYQQRWVKRDQLEALRQRDELAKATGIALDVVGSPRFAVFTDLGEEKARSLVDTLERACDIFYELFPMEQELWQKPLIVLLFEEQGDYARYVQYFGEENRQGRSWIELNKKSHGFYHWMPPASVDLVEGRQEETLVSSSVHKVAHVLLNLFHFKYNYLPAWLDEGFAVEFERRVLGDPQTFCLGEPVRGNERAYGRKSPSSVQEKWKTASSWRDLVRTDVASGRDRDLLDIVVLRLDELTTGDLAKSSSVVQLLLEDPKRFGRFVESLRRLLPRFEITPNVAEKRRYHDEACQTTLGKSLKQLDEHWRDVVRGF